MRILALIVALIGSPLAAMACDEHAAVETVTIPAAYTTSVECCDPLYSYDVATKPTAAILNREEIGKDCGECVGKFLAVTSGCASIDSGDALVSVPASDVYHFHLAGDNFQ